MKMQVKKPSAGKSLPHPNLPGACSLTKAASWAGGRRAELILRKKKNRTLRLIHIKLWLLPLDSPETKREADEQKTPLRPGSWRHISHRLPPPHGTRVWDNRFLMGFFLAFRNELHF